MQTALNSLRSYASYANRPLPEACDRIAKELGKAEVRCPGQLKQRFDEGL